MKYLQNVKPIFLFIGMFPSKYVGGGTCKSCCLYGSKVALSKQQTQIKQEKNALCKINIFKYFSELNTQELSVTIYMRCVGNGENFKIDIFSFPFLSIRFSDNRLVLFNQNLICCSRTQQVISEFCSTRVQAYTTSQSLLIHQSAVLSLVKNKGNGNGERLGTCLMV